MTATAAYNPARWTEWPQGSADCNPLPICAPDPCAVHEYQNLCLQEPHYVLLLKPFWDLWMFANKDRAAQDQQITWPGDGRVTSVNEAFDRLFEMTPEKLMPEEYFMPDENLTWGDFANMLTTTHDNILAIENFKLACNSLFQMNGNTTPLDPLVQVPMVLQDESMIVPYLLPVTTAWLAWEDTALGYSLNVPSMVQPHLADVFQKVSSLYGNTTFNDMQKAMQTFFSIDVFRQFMDLRDSEYMLFGDFERDSSEDSAECQCVE